MKKTLKLIACMLMVLGCVKANADIVINEHNGGKSGYYTVTEKHDAQGSSLDCNDPGYSDCCFEEPANDVINTYSGPVSIKNTILPAVGHQLTNGVLSGSMQYSPYIVSWNGTDAYNCQLHITL